MQKFCKLCIGFCCHFKPEDYIKLPNNNKKYMKPLVAYYSILLSNSALSHFMGRYFRIKLKEQNFWKLNLALGFR